MQQLRSDATQNPVFETAGLHKSTHGGAPQYIKVRPGFNLFLPLVTSTFTDVAFCPSEVLLDADFDPMELIAGHICQHDSNLEKSSRITVGGRIDRAKNDI